jgi:hypothetical protein
MGLAKADDSIRDTSAVRVIENGLLADQLTDNQQLLVGMTSGGQKAATTGNQGIDACQIPRQVPQLLLDGLADLVDTWLLLLGNSKKLLPRFPAVCTGFVAKVFPDLWMHCIDQDLSDLSGLIEQ